jgi:hypothetical protein
MSSNIEQELIDKIAEIKTKKEEISDRAIKD